MENSAQERRWFWATLILSSISIIAVVFALWELVENRFFHDVDYVALHYLYISRGIASSLLLAIWAAWFVLRQRRRAEEELRRSRERYRGLLESSPGAVALFDSSLAVHEWNAAAERLYGFPKNDVLGAALPTIPADKRDELVSFMTLAAAGQPVLDRETRRLHRSGDHLQVQASLLPFNDAGQTYYLEVTSDIGERVKLRQRLLEFEKLTTIGKMAAGTAHHLNTPLASMLLRVQMMRDRVSCAELARELHQMEQSIGFCQKFVRRLLDFSRRPTSARKLEDVPASIQAVLGFLAPSFLAKKTIVATELSGAQGVQVMADPNQLETVFLILLSNALDAVELNGKIKVQCCHTDGVIEVAIADDGCGIPESALPHVLEPFFTTKPPGKGTGLGLAIAESVVSEHGGKLRIESREHEGTRVTVQLPVHRTTTSPAEVAS